MKNERNKLRYGEWSLALGGFLVLFCFFYCILPYHLFHREQTSIFLYAAEYIYAYWEKPGGLVSLLGDFMTQFYYYIGVGPFVLTSVLTLLGGVVYIGFRKYWGSWSFIPAIGIVVWETGRQSLLDYPLSSTWALIGGIMLALLIRRYAEKRYYGLICLLMIPLSYYLTGYGVCMTLIFIVLEKRYLLSLGICLETVALILLLKPLFMLTWREAFFYPSSALYGKPNLREERHLALDSELYFGHWEKLMALLQEEDLQTSYSSYCYNLAYARAGRLPDALMHYYQPAANGLFLPVNPSFSYQKIYAANEIWFFLGDMTMAEHASMLGMIFSPRNRGARAIKRLAEINLINHDDEVAMKYLRLLQHTLCYRSWAEKRIPGQQSTEVKKWLQQKRSLIPASDTLRSASQIGLSLRHLLNGNAKNLIARDYLLCYDLLIKDIGSFAADYEKYESGDAPSALYAQALLIYLAGGGQLNEANLVKFQIPVSVAEEFADYTQLYQTQQGSTLQSKYGQSYWFYFHYAKMNR